MSIHLPSPKLAKPVAVRHFAIPDPVRPMQSCDVRIDSARVTLRRNIDGVTMYIGLAMQDYKGIVAAEDEVQGYHLRLICRNAAMNLPLGRFATLDQLAQSWKDWGHFTGLPMLIETETGLVRPALPQKSTLRPRLPSVLKNRRGGFAQRRKAGEQSRMERSYHGAREIVCYE